LLAPAWANMLSLLFDSTLQLEPTAVSRRTVHFILLTIVLIAAGLAGTRMTATEPEPIRIDAGLISGVSGEHDAGVRVFKGVPFAAPPLGPLRWRPPAPVQHWDSVLRAYRFSAVCPQPPRTANFALAGTLSS
jgi:hypothetical protein